MTVNKTIMFSGRTKELFINKSQEAKGLGSTTGLHIRGQCQSPVSRSGFKLQHNCHLFVANQNPSINGLL